MAQVVIASPPDHTALVKYSDFKAEFGIADAADAVSAAILLAASSRVESILGRPLVRAQYTETIRGSNRKQLFLAVRPLITLDAISYSGDAETVGDYEIDGRDTGSIRKVEGGNFADDGYDSWVVTYTAGWFVPEDNLSISVSVSDVDDSYNSSALFPTHAKPGDVFAASGWTAGEVANNGNRKVVTATTSKITVANALTTAVAGTRTMAFNNLPGAITRAVTMLARNDYLIRTNASGGALIEESISGATTLRYSAPESGSASVEQSAASILAPFMDF